MTKWEIQVEKAIKQLKKMQPSDRMEYHSAIQVCNNAVWGTVKGWLEWIINPDTMKEFEEEEFKEMFQQFRSLAIAFLEHDVKWTKRLKSKLDKQKEKKNQRKPDYIT